MNSEFFKAIDLIEAEKGIPADYMLEKVEAALLSAAKKAFGTSDNAMVVINKEKKDIKLYQVKTIVETVENEATEISLAELLEKGSKRAKLGGQIKREVKTKEFGRIAAQAAKQVIIQGIRDADGGGDALAEVSEDDRVREQIDAPDELSGDERGSIFQEITEKNLVYGSHHSDAESELFVNESHIYERDHGLADTRDECRERGAPDAHRRKSRLAEYQQIIQYHIDKQ